MIAELKQMPFGGNLSFVNMAIQTICNVHGFGTENEMVKYVSHVQKINFYIFM